MPNTPIDEHTQESEQLAGLRALGLLEGDELARFEGHSAECEQCRLMLRLDIETLARLSLVAPAMNPSPDFKARLMRRAAEELAHSEPVPAPEPITRASQEPTQLRSQPAKVVPLWRRSPWLSALAAVFVVAIVAAGAFTYENQPVASFELKGSVQGSAKVVVRRSGAAELDMTGVPNPEPGFVYEAWIIPPDKQPVAAGTTSTGEAKLPLPADLAGKTVAVTVERGRVDAPTSAPILATVVPS